MLYHPTAKSLRWSINVLYRTEVSDALSVAAKMACLVECLLVNVFFIKSLFRIGQARHDGKSLELFGRHRPKVRAAADTYYGVISS
jgi:hypothetical protein